MGEKIWGLAKVSERWDRWVCRCGAQEKGLKQVQMGTQHLCVPLGGHGVVVKAEDHPRPGPEGVQGDSRTRRSPGAPGEAVPRTGSGQLCWVLWKRVQTPGQRSVHLLVSVTFKHFWIL